VAQEPEAAPPFAMVETDIDDGDDGNHRARSVAPPNVEHIVTEPSRPVSRPSPSDDAGERGLDPALAEAPDAEHHEVEPDQIADEIHRLNELDLEDVEHTEMAGIPVGPSGFGTEPSAVEKGGLAARLEAQLAEAEAEADADDLGLAGAPGMPVYGDPAAGYEERAGVDAELAEPSVDLGLEEVDELEILAEADADDADLLAAHGEQEASSSHVIHDRPVPSERRSSELDFAGLDLGDESGVGDDSDLYFAVSPAAPATPHVLDGLHDEFSDRDADAHLDSAGHALAAFETGDESLDDLDGPAGLEPRRGVQPIFEPEPTSTFTHAGAPSDSFDLELPLVFRTDSGAPTRPLKNQGRQHPAAANQAMASQAQNRPAANPGVKSQPARSSQEPAILRHEPSLSSLYETPVEDHELESALEALDVELDDLSIPQAEAQLPQHRDAAKSRPTPMIRQAPQAHTPPAQARAPVPVPAPAQGRARVPTPIQGRVPVPMPSRVLRPTGPVGPVSGRIAVPRAPTDDGVVIDLDDDDG